MQHKKINNESGKQKDIDFIVTYCVATWALEIYETFSWKNNGRWRLQVKVHVGFTNADWEVKRGMRNSVPRYDMEIKETPVTINIDTQIKRNARVWRQAVTESLCDSVGTIWICEILLRKCYNLTIAISQR